MEPRSGSAESSMRSLSGLWPDRLQWSRARGSAERPSFATGEVKLVGQDFGGDAGGALDERDDVEEPMNARRIVHALYPA